MKIHCAPALALALLLTFSACATNPAETVSAPASAPASAEATPTATPEPTPRPDPTVSTLLVCGDVMSHSTNVTDAWDPQAGAYNYLREIGSIRSWVEGADYAVANLETTLAEGNYSGYPSFRSPDALAYNLKDLGFDMMLTANNHCLDAGFKGLCRTLDVLDQAGLAHVGTSRTQAEADSDVVLADVGGISVAFLGYTYGTNGIPLPESAPFAVNLFNTDYMTNLSEFDETRVLADLDKAKALEPDLIAVMMHWGWEYHTAPNDYQKELADFLIAHGADLVLGGHPHVLQPVEEVRTVTLADGSNRSGFVSYSLGNLISGQFKDLTDATVLLSITLTRDNVTGQSAVTSWQYVPIYRTNDSHQGVRFQLVNPYDATDNAKAQAALESIHKIMGREHDYQVMAQSAS